MKTALRIAGILVTLVLLAGIMGYLSGFFEPKIPVDSRTVERSQGNGREYTIAMTTEPLVEQASGTLRSKIESVISPLITASILSITVRAGDEAKQGDVLVRLDSREIKARLAQNRQAVAAAQARLSRSEKDFKRVQRIRKADPGAISKAKLDQTQAALETAKANLLRVKRQVDEARTTLSYTTLVAPISGRVVERYSDPGDTAQQGSPLLRLYDPRVLRLEANVRESVASKLQIGKKLKVWIDAVAKEFDARVDEIVPSADPGSRTFLVKAGLTGASALFPGMFGRLLIPIGQTQKPIFREMH